MGFGDRNMWLGHINLDTLIFVIAGFLALRTLIKDYIQK